MYSQMYSWMYLRITPLVSHFEDIWTTNPWMFGSLRDLPRWWTVSSATSACGTWSSPHRRCLFFPADLRAESGGSMVYMDLTWPTNTYNIQRYHQLWFYDGLKWLKYAVFWVYHGISTLTQCLFLESPYRSVAGRSWRDLELVGPCTEPFADASDPDIAHLERHVQESKVQLIWVCNPYNPI